MQQLRAIADAASLMELDKLLTQSMAQLQIQALLKDDGLSKVLARVEALSQADDDETASLQTLAVLGRLAAVARGREGTVNRTVVALAPEHDLPSLEGLDSDGKAYAAQCLLQLDTYWLNDYALRESVVLDTAEKPRKLLIELLLKLCECRRSVGGACRGAGAVGKDHQSRVALTPRATYQRSLAGGIARWHVRAGWTIRFGIE